MYIVKVHVIVTFKWIMIKPCTTFRCLYYDKMPSYLIQASWINFYHVSNLNIIRINWFKSNLTTTSAELWDQLSRLTTTKNVILFLSRLFTSLE